MINEQIGLQLHDKATRGLALTALETTHLKQWYAEQDALEMQEFPLEHTTSLATSIQTQIQTSLQQIAALTQQIEQMIAENKRLKQQNEQLGLQVAQLYGSQAA